jgi:hypothetical protein
MPYYPGRPVRARIGVEFVEADVQIGFDLVDLAQQESICGDSSLVARILDDAVGVLDDIGQRLTHLSNGDRASFGPLVAELRREVELARARNYQDGLPGKS